MCDRCLHVGSLNFRQILAVTHCVQNYIFPHFVMVITALWAELWFVVARCYLAKSIGIVHILIRIHVGYFRYIKQEREDVFLVASTAYSMVLQITKQLKFLHLWKGFLHQKCKNPFQRCKNLFGCRFGDFVLIPTYKVESLQMCHLRAKNKGLTICPTDEFVCFLVSISTYSHVKNSVFFFGHSVFFNIQNSIYINV